MKDEVKAESLSFILHPSAFILSASTGRVWLKRNTRPLSMLPARHKPTADDPRARRES